MDYDIKQFLEKDAKANVISKGITPPCIWQYIKLLRKIENLLSKPKRGYINRILTRILLIKYRKLGLKLHYEIYPFTCGPGLRLLHPGGIIVNPDTQIGSNCTLRSFSVIGNKATGIRNSSPKIGNNVDIGCNVTIIGPINIGDNVCIGAGSVVVSDIPSNSICVGNPAHVIQK